MSPTVLNYVPVKSGASTICLCMIVRNEAAIIRRCLDSVKPHITAACIVDTGSTDNTIEVIADAMQDVPGVIHQRPWVDFATNRNEAMELAREQGCDYLMFIDADEELVCGKINHRLEGSVYLVDVWCGDQCGARVWLVKSDYPGRWVGEIHEDLEVSGLWIHAKGRDPKIISHNDGARAKDPERYNNDLKLLFKALEKNPNDTRSLYYVGATYYAAGDFEQARRAFELRVQQEGDPNERALALSYLKKIKGEK